MNLTKAEGREIRRLDLPARLANGTRGPSSSGRTEENGDSSLDQGVMLIGTVD